jgi:simple sugar transport system substrate-binding protein
VYYDKVVADVLGKTWKTGAIKWGTKEGVNDFVKINDAVPAAIKAKVAAAKDGLKAGTLAVFKGPLSDNTGKEVLAKGVAADDKWLGQVSFFLQGVEGKPPTSK